MALLDDVRFYLRIDATDTSFDVEIQDLIGATQAELTDVGVDPTLVADATDPLIKKAIVTYCKAYFGYDTDNAKAFIAAYESIKIYLMNSGTYQAVTT